MTQWEVVIPNSDIAYEFVRSLGLEEVETDDEEVVVIKCLTKSSADNYMRLWEQLNS